jgi:hypothetical protein
MITRKDLFAKVVMVENPWYVREIKFDQQAGKEAAYTIQCLWKGIVNWIDFKITQVSWKV